MYRKNVAGQHIGFCLVSATGGGGISGATVAVDAVIDGAVQTAATGTVTSMGGGQYDFAPTAADINGNNISYLFSATGTVPVEKTIVATSANPSDGAAFGLTDLAALAVGVNVSQWLGHAPPTTNVNGVPIVDLAYANGAPALDYDGILQSGTANTATLASTASTVDGFYEGRRFDVVSGTGIDEFAFITAYVGSSRLATFDRTLGVALDNTSAYSIDKPVPANLVSVNGTSFAGANVPTTGGSSSATLTLPMCTVTAVASQTSITASGSFNASAGAYSPTANRVRFLYWLTGNNQSEFSSIASYSGSGAFVLDLAPPQAIVSSDTFLIV